MSRACDKAVRVRLGRVRFPTDGLAQAASVNFGALTQSSRVTACQAGGHGSEARTHRHLPRSANEAHLKIRKSACQTTDAK